MTTRARLEAREVLENALLDEVTELPVGQDAAMRLLVMFDDPSVSTATLGSVVESDPALTVQILRTANSPFYGLSRRVASVRQAIVVLGYPMVRSLAAAKVFKLGSREGQRLPESFWEHSFTSAAAASVLARPLGAPPDDAFSAGLLLDVGTALLRRHDPVRYTEVLRLIGTGKLQIEAERAVFGLTHPEVSAVALERLRFPARVVDAVAEHHLMPALGSSPLARTLFLADLLAHEVDGSRYESVGTLVAGLEWLGLDPAGATELVQQTRDALEHVAPLRVVVAG